MSSLTHALAEEKQQMRRAAVAMLALVTLTIAGCGGGSHFADKSRPPTPVNVTVYIANSRVSVSPSSVGAGPVVFIITNQASRAEALTVRDANGGNPLANTAPINPQATSQVTVNFREGNYTLTTSTPASSDASAVGTTVQPASFHIGRSRPNANNALLEP
jgi:hypothetical protein